MRGLCCGLTLFSSLLASCSFPPPPDVADDGDVERDAAPIDGTPSPDMNTAMAQIVAEETSHDFNDVVVGQQSALLSVVIRNGGDAPSSELDVTLAGSHAGDFALVPIGDGSDCDGRTLDVNQTCLVQLRFAPGAAGAREGTLRVTATEGGTASVTLTGNGLSPGNLQITVGETLSFGTVAIQSSTTAQTITVRNSGRAATASLTATVGDLDNYTKTGDTCSGAPLGAGATCDVQVRFNPTTVGSRPTQVSIRESETTGVSASAAGTGSATITVTGGQGGTIASDPAGISCGSTCSATFTQSPVTLTATVPSGYAFDGWTGACASEGTNGTCAVDLTVPATSAGATFRQWSCTPNTIVCDDANEHYVDCTSDGRIEFEMDCLLGCASGVEKCLDLDPSVDTSETALGGYLDLASTAPNITFTGSSTINTDTAATSNAGTTITIPSDVIDGKRVFRLHSLSVAAGSTLKISGSLPIVFLVYGDVTVAGLVDVSADGKTSGPGIRKAAFALCDGKDWEADVAYIPGGGGASRASTGAKGGNTASGSGGIQGSSFSDSDIIPLQGGCVGGRSIDSNDVVIPGGVCHSRGGGGGGAIQIASRGTITVTGQIDAGGGGGESAGGYVFVNGVLTEVPCGGGGGGSGGTVLFEAVSVVLTGSAAIVAAEGGGGGAASMGGIGAQGEDGDTDATAPAGGTSSGYPSGGNGAGSTSANATAGANGTGSQNGAGGGGGLGESRINTGNGTFIPQAGATIRAKNTIGSVKSRQVP